jgi:hydroxypyruvate isomerase
LTSVLKFSANLSFLYQDLPFLDRFKAAAADGFPAVEYLGPYADPKEKVAEALAANGLKQALFNAPYGDWAAGERGIGSLPDRVDEFRAGVATAIDYAKALDCPKVNVLAGLTKAGANEDIFVGNLKYAAPRFADAGIKLLIEPINTRDIPGFFLTTSAQAERVLERVGHDNLYIQYDIYHMQVMQGDLMPTYERLKDRIAHIQVADNPGRNEPGTGEINYAYVFAVLDRLGYDGFVGCEYKPKAGLAGTSAGLGWMSELL